MGQPVAFFEITSADHERAQRFYGALFGGQVSADPSMGRYALVDTGAGDGAVGGGIDPSETDLPAGYGRFAMFADPGGNSVGLWA